MPTTHGEPFGPFRLEETLGRGGMGEVWRAYDTRNDTWVALKRLVLPTADPAAGERFRRESELLNALRHPHVVGILDYGEVSGQPYLATQLVEGTDLERRLASGVLEPGYAVRVLTQVADALDAAHRAGIVHRDVKPSNILLAGPAADQAVLADFGIAKPLSADATKLTSAGQIGTLDYMAPERLLGADVDGRADVYALACVLFQCLTGKLPFPAEDPAGKLAAQLNDPPPAPSLFGRLPPALDLVVATGMDKDPARRYPTAGQLMAAAAAALKPAPGVVNAVNAGPAPTLEPALGPMTDAAAAPILRAIVSVAGNRMPAAAGAGRQELFFTGHPNELIPAGPSTSATPPGGGRQELVFTGHPNKLIPAGPPTSAPPPGDRCPYPGLRSFSGQETELFRGREQAVTDVLVRMSRLTRVDSLLLVTGASGTGKSSLLRAGVLPALAAAEGAWPQVVLTPGSNPFGTLAARLAPILGTDPGRLASRLREHPDRFGSALPDRLVLVVDQAEELFTAVADPAEREAFATALTHAWPALTVVAVRADFLEQCLRLPPLRPALAHPYLLRPLEATDLERVITEPARLAGLELEPGLVDRLITDVGAQGGRLDEPGVLPRLAHALRQTWERRSGNVLTLRAYQETGGVDRAVAQTADGVYQRLPEAERPRLRAALLRMVAVVDSGGLARRRASRDEIPDELVDRLVEARLASAGTEGVQLSHDALLTAWPRLRQWVEEDRQGLLLRQRLGEAVTSWETGGRDQGELYRGARLAAALEWADGRTDLTKQEQAFLAESRRLQRRATRRLRATVVTLAGLLVLSLVAGALAVMSRNTAEREKATAEHAAALANSRRLAAESLTHVDNDPVRARRSALEAWRTGSTGEARSALLSNVVPGYPATFESGVDTPTAVDFSPDGRYVAVGGVEGEVAVVDSRSREPVATGLKHGQAVTDAEFSPDGRLLATATAADVRIWAVPSGRPVRTIQGVGAAVAWRSGEVVATAQQAGGGYVIAERQARTGAELRRLTEPTLASRPVHTIAYSRDGTRLALGLVNGTVDLWDTAGRKRLLLTRAHVQAAGGRRSPAYVTFSGQYLASGAANDRLIRLWDPRTGKPAGEIEDPTYDDPRGKRGGPVVFTADGRSLLAPDVNGTVVVGLSPDEPRSEEYATYVRGPVGSNGGRSAISAIAASGDGEVVAVLADGTVRRWGRNPHWYADPTAAVSDVAFVPGTKQLSAAAGDGVFTWDTSTGARSALTATSGSKPVAVAYTKDGTQVVGSDDATVTITPPGKGTASRTLRVPDRRLADLVVSPDGTLVAAVLQDPTVVPGRETYEIRVWERATGRQRGVAEIGRNHLPTRLQFAPDSRSLAGVIRIAELGEPYGAEIRTWRSPDLQRIGTRRIGSGVIDDAAFTPDGRLVTTTSGGRMQLRDGRTGRVLKAFGTHPAAIQALAVSPDGRLTATATTDDRIIRLWDLTTGQRVGQLTWHHDQISDLEFSPDSRMLASAGADTDVGLWLVRTTDAAEQICADLADAGERPLEC
ncbi:nSTAND1 domain-containing NTPase [Flindersiella endophytica]